MICKRAIECLSLGCLTEHAHWNIWAIIVGASLMFTTASWTRETRFLAAWLLKTNLWSWIIFAQANRCSMVMSSVGKTVWPLWRNSLIDFHVPRVGLWVVGYESGTFFVSPIAVPAIEKRRRSIIFANKFADACSPSFLLLVPRVGLST